jgi:sterol desaturase/sphingolipid hydroxylase (fatty acid hydroxylase superfamily)
LITALVVFGSLVAVAVWELCRPRRQREFPALRRRFANLGVWVVNLVLVAWLLPKFTIWGPSELMPGMALLPWPAVGIGLSLVIGFLVLDCMHYWVHRTEHAVPLLWRFHALHHTDPDVDVTTSVRHHPIEYVAASFVYWAAATVMSIPISIVMTHALAVFGAASLQHGNIKLPKGIERVLQPLLNTMDLHRLHHSIKASEANANYGAVLSIWDRAFGTLVQASPEEHQRIAFGVAEVPRRDGLSPAAMLLTPWRLGRTPASRGRRLSGGRSTPSRGKQRHRLSSPAARKSRV